MTSTLCYRAHCHSFFRNGGLDEPGIFDYPGYGYSEGKPNEAGCYAAADAAYDWLTDSGAIAPKDIILFGESLGGGVATDLAVRRQHQALVLVKTFASVPDMARSRVLTSAFSVLVRNRFDSLSKISRCPGPIFIAHGNFDRVIPLSQAEKLVQSAPEPKRFFLLEGSDHNDPLPMDFYISLAQFLGIGD